MFKNRKLFCSFRFFILPLRCFSRLFTSLLIFIMTRQDLSDDAFQALLSSIYPIIMSHGIKATTMDLVASSLSMSKRTLYEIFDSKQNMISQAMEHIFEIHRQKCIKVFEEAPDVMSAMITIFLSRRDFFGNVTPDFFRDMDSYLETRDVYQDQETMRANEMMTMFELGIKQGMFRADVNYQIMMRMIDVQFQSIKRMEQIFPPDITPLHIYDTILIGFLRSIASPEGMKLLDSLTRSSDWSSWFHNNAN